MSNLSHDSSPSSPSIKSRPLGKLPDGRVVDAWTLIGAGGLELEVITYGGIIKRLLAPDRDGQLEDVVLGFDDLESYFSNDPYLGAVVGRVAGRIPDGRFCVDGQEHKVVQNDGTNHIHGGIVGLDKRLWAAEPVERSDGAPSLRLTYRSPDGEEGYPGNVDFTVTYTVTPDNAVVYETHAESDAATPVSLTQHSYFNLAGEGSGDIKDHEVQIHCDTKIAVDENLTPLGVRESVSGSAADLYQSRRVGDIIPDLWLQHGDCYRVEHGEGEADALISVARLAHPGTGRVIDVSTTLSCLQFYTGKHLPENIKGKSGHTYGPFSGLCLECEGYPDGVSKPEFGDILVRPGHPQHHVTIYAFSVIA